MNNCMKPLSQALSSKGYSNCAICHSLLQIPIMLVENLGNVCESCCLKNCAASKAIRNIVLEFIIKKLPFPCKHRTEGCKKEILYNQLKEHEKACEFRKIRCLYPFCGWIGSTKLYLNHFESCHKANVIKASNGEFCIYLKLVHPNELYCLKKNNRSHSFLKIFEKIMVDFQIGVCFRIYEDSDFPCSNYTLTLTGEDNTKVVLTCQSSPLDSWRDGSNVAEKIMTRSMLTALSGQKSSLQLRIKIESESVVHEKVKQCLECPVCFNIMRPPIYQCSTGHSLCKECKAKVTECPWCKSFPINTRNYALEVLTADIFYECNSCKEMVLGKLLVEHVKSCKSLMMKKRKSRSKSLSRYPVME